MAWIARTDEEGAVYYENKATGETTWERPAEMGSASNQENPLPTVMGRAVVSAPKGSAPNAPQHGGGCVCPPPPEGHCATAGCCLTPGCKKGWGIAFSAITLSFGIVSALLGLVLAGSALTMVLMPVNDQNHNLLFLAVTGYPVYFSSSSVWYLGDGTRAFYATQWTVAALWSLTNGALLILVALAHPKAMPCFAKLGSRNPMWLLDPFVRLGGQGFLLQCASFGGGGFWAWTFNIAGTAYIVCAIIDCFFHFLPQPAPLLSKQCGGGECGEAPTNVGGMELEECEGDTDLKGLPCVAFQCGGDNACCQNFKGGSFFAIFNIAHAVLTMFGASFGKGIVGNNWGLIVMNGYVFSTIAVMVLFTSLITPKTLWVNLWFLDPLRSFLGFGMLLLYFALQNVHWAVWIFYSNSAAVSGTITINSYLSLINAFGIFACAIAYIVFGCINMCCRVNCCNGKGVPLPFPLLRYWIWSRPTLQIQKAGGPDDTQTERAHVARGGDEKGDEGRSSGV